jgi:hypothetical protein
MIPRYLVRLYIRSNDLQVKYMIKKNTQEAMSPKKGSPFHTLASAHFKLLIRIVDLKK